MKSKKLQSGAKPSPITTWQQSFPRDLAQPCHLLGLPRELRDMVLEALLLRNKPLSKGQCNCHTCMNRRLKAVGRHGGLPTDRVYKFPAHDDAIVPTEILSSCRQLCNEAALVFFSKNAFRLEGMVLQPSFGPLLRHIRNFNAIIEWRLHKIGKDTNVMELIAEDVVLDLAICTGLAPNMHSFTVEIANNYPRYTTLDSREVKDFLDNVGLIAKCIEKACTSYYVVIPKALQVSLVYSPKEHDRPKRWVEMMPAFQIALDTVKALQEAEH